MADGGDGSLIALYTGSVMHSRVRPRRNHFRYGVFFLRFRLGDEDRLQRSLLSVDRFNMLAFHRRDHGPRDGTPLEPWIRTLLRDEGCGFADGDIHLQTFPRVLGYVFNPVSFWLCHDRAGALRAVLCEVNNTFGEHHNYLLAHEDGRPIGPDDVLETRKVFHVSPFLAVDGGYRFKFRIDPKDTRIRIDYGDERGTMLVTAVHGQAGPLTSGSLLRCFVGYPWMTLGVILRIHWQALKLWSKGVPFFRKPVAPMRETTR